jgi:hypothetical protein
MIATLGDVRRVKVGFVFGGVLIWLGVATLGGVWVGVATLGVVPCGIGSSSMMLGIVPGVEYG